MLISKKIEDRVLEISRGKHEFKLRPVSKAEALELYKDNVYKTELLPILRTEPLRFAIMIPLLIYVVVTYSQYRNHQSDEGHECCGAYWSDEKSS
jgi:hypothetical protein